MTLKMPVGCTTEASRLSFTYRTLELLRLRFNQEGTRFRNGDITRAEFDAWQNSWYRPRFLAAHEALGANRTLAHDGKTPQGGDAPWNPDIDTDFS